MRTNPRKFVEFFAFTKQIINKLWAVWLQFDTVARIAGTQTRTADYRGFDSYLRPLLDARHGIKSLKSLLPNPWDHNEII